MKRWISFLLALSLALGAMSLAACSDAPDESDDRTCCADCNCNKPQDGGGEQTPTTPDNDEPTDEDDTGNAPVTQNPGKYDDYYLSEEKLEDALAEALMKINRMMLTFDEDSFPAHNSTDNVYPAVANNSGWNQGFWTGMLWHSYELTEKTKYLTAAMEQIPSYANRIDKKLGVNTHDMGFVFT